MWTSVTKCRDLNPDMISSMCKQVQLYEDFAKSRAKVNVDDVLSTAAQEEEDKPKLKATGHVFQVRDQWRSPHDKK